MWSLSLPWWELIVRAVAVYAALLLLVRLSGKRTVGQFTPFDLLVVMLLSEAVSNGMSGGDESVTAGLVVAVTLVVLNGLAGFATSRSRRIEALLDGTPVLLGRDGRRFDEQLRRHRVGYQDFEQALREADCPIEQMRCAFLEIDGRISILKQPQQR